MPAVVFLRQLDYLSKERSPALRTHLTAGVLSAEVVEKWVLQGNYTDTCCAADSLRGSGGKANSALLVVLTAFQVGVTSALKGKRSSDPCRDLMFAMLLPHSSRRTHTETERTLSRGS